MNYHRILNILLAFALLLFAGDKAYSLLLKPSGFVKAASGQDDFNSVSNVPTSNGEGILSIPAAAFQPMHSGITFHNGGNLLFPESHAYSGNIFYAPVYLPNSVTVTKVIFIWRDFASIDGSIGLRRSEFVYNSSEFMASVSTNGNSGPGKTETSIIEKPTIDNRNHSYYLELSLPYQDVVHNTTVYSVFIEYAYMTYLPVTFK